ncbi:hypothetical protein AVEN_163339-1 [Araneus ventricosus]|uniref:Tc1-like transposase DDE domain-containing protein n=1 Tax=Araneus ventricosus TaxID=182803 RepID=A0A4Y2VBC5_ARAVE|nr:hypothetical protein AVEN_163339-1 [Araneus ventricosus]
MSSRRHLPAEFHYRALYLLEAGQQLSDIARWLNVDRSVVSRLWNQFITTSAASRRPIEGRTVLAATVRRRLHEGGLVILHLLTSGEKQTLDIFRITYGKGTPIQELVFLYWEGVCLDGHTDLYLLPYKNLNAQRYKDDILDSIVCPYSVAIRDTFILQADNARSHTARLVQQFLEEETTVQMEWPVRFLDLNPITACVGRSWEA